MPSLEDEVLRHRFIYIPWVNDDPVYEHGPQLALYLHRMLGGRLTVVCPQNSSAPKGLGKTPVVAERSGSVEDGGVVLAYCPTYKVMNKTTRLQNSVIILVEWPTESFEGWARLVSAYNVVTGSVMTTNLTDEGKNELDGVLFEGYKGWHDDIAERMTLSHLKKLALLNQYDREVVLAYMRAEKSELSMKRLVKLLDRFDTSEGKLLSYSAASDKNGHARLE